MKHNPLKCAECIRLGWVDTDPLHVEGDEPDITEGTTHLVGWYLLAVVTCFAGMALIGAVAFLGMKR